MTAREPIEGQLDLFAAAAELAAAEIDLQVPASTGAGTAPGPTTVVDLHGRRDDPAYADVLYVGRAMFLGGWRLAGHLLANPYRVGRDGDAHQVVARYEAWALACPDLPERLAGLRGRRLGCWCPDGAPCHARVLARLADLPAARLRVLLRPDPAEEA